MTLWHALGMLHGVTADSLIMIAFASPRGGIRWALLLQLALPSYRYLQ